MAFDLSALSAYTEERADEFFSRAVLTGVTAANSTVLTGLKGPTAIPDIDLATAGIFQDGNTCADNNAGTIAFAQRTIDPKQFKIQMQFCVVDLERFFTQKALPAGSTYEGLHPTNARLLEHIQSRIQRVVEINLWQGEEGGSSGDSSLNLMDGLDTIIADEISATSIPAGQQLSGSQDSSNVVASFDAMRAALPVDQFQDVDMMGPEGYILLTDPISKDNYHKNYRSSFTALNERLYTDLSRTQLDNSNIEIIGAPGLHGTGKSLLIKRKNLWLGVDIDGEETNLQIVQGAGGDIDNVYVHGRFKMGVQIQFPEEVVTNNY